MYERTYTRGTARNPHECYDCRYAIPVIPSRPRATAAHIDAALRVIASRGVAGTSHRVVAAEAHVPLGSMTYYFDGMHDLLHQAFDQFARAPY